MQIKPEKKSAYLFLFRVKASFALVNAKAYLQGEKKKKQKQKTKESPGKCYTPN